MKRERRSRTWLWVVLAGVVCGGISYFYGVQQSATQQKGAALPQMRPTPPVPPLPGPSAPPGAGAPIPMPSRGVGPGMPGLPLSGGRMMAAVDLNSAPVSQLETLPGMTPDYARKIMAGRPFRTFADLERIGIPADVLQAMSPPAMIRSTGLEQPPAGEIPHPPARP
jgi:competence protein ComEA